MSNQVIIKPEIESEIEIEKKKDKKFKDDKKLTPKLKKPLTEALPKTETSCLHGKDVQAIRFDFSHIDNLLSNMNSPQEKIKWLKTYLKQLRQSQRTMYMSAQGLPALRTVEEQYNSLSPYTQIYPFIINKIQNKIRRLRAQAWQRK